MNQAAIDFARAAGEDGMQRAEARAERHVPGWASIALTVLARFAISKGAADRFTAEDVSDLYAADPFYVQPPDQRAWGGVFKRARKLKIIAAVDTLGIRRKGHGVVGATRYKSLVSGKRWTEVPLA